MKDAALVIMAAGIGSRFGTGIKQLEAMGPGGEIIMDYSIHDAIEAGFKKIIFIIRRDLEKDFKEIIGNRIEKIADVAYAFQERDDLPEGFSCPEDRTKPWGTGQAVLSCRNLIDGPFAVINADDYYGKKAFQLVYQYLTQESREGEKLSICMAGFVLGNTLSENGTVTRGVCHVNEQGCLTGVTETSNIVKTKDGAGVLKEDKSVDPLDANNLVSMNMWGLTPAFMSELESGFTQFLGSVKEGDLKAEYLLPTIVDQLIKADKAEVAVLKTEDTWFGVTYQEDTPVVKAAFAKLVQEGVYQSPLYK